MVAEWTNMGFTTTVPLYVVICLAVMSVIRCGAIIVPKECGVQDGVLFCIDHINCTKQCDRPCELISSFELRNLNYFAEKRIEAIPTESSANDYHFNYFDIEMAHYRPGLCGAYAIQKLPKFAVSNTQSTLHQLVNRLNVERDRTLYAHSQCDHSCSFGCHRVGYNKDVIRALKGASIRFDITLHECKPIPAWFIYSVILSAYSLLVVIGLLTYKCCILDEEDVRRMYNYQYSAGYRRDSYTSWKETPPSNVVSRSSSVTSSRTGYSGEEDSE